MTIESVTFQSTISGEHLVVFGAIHGNEYCGPQAIYSVIDKMRSGEVTLKQGKVTFVPICNPWAYAQKTRFVERNLNRHFYPKEQHQYYEDSLDPILCNFLEDADILLDIHSYQSQGGAFAFIGTSSQREIDFARALGVSHHIYGWAEAFGDEHASEEQKRASIGTTDYTRAKKKAGIAVTIECGHHHNKDNAAIGEEAILRSMAFANLIQPVFETVNLQAQHAIKMRSVHYKQYDGVLSKPYKHMDRVQQGEVIAQYDNGSVIVAVEDGVIVLPKTQTDYAIGSEWFYFGVETDFPAPQPLSLD